MAEEKKFGTFLDNCRDMVSDGEEVEEPKEKPKEIECARCKKIKSLFK